jgi:hypothetical protein
MSERIRIILLALVTTVSLISPVEADYPENDSDADTRVFAEQLNQRVLPLAINEFMASNRSTSQDPQGQYDDWIEIHNYGADALNVGGMYLTDDLAVPTQWLVPDNDPAATTIPAGGYLLIWADNDTEDPGLHANFRLNAGGEEIGLFDTDGATLIDSIVFPDQSADVSFGRFPDANDEVRFFGFPSPEAENTGGYLGEVADLKFSRDHGFYDTPFSVTIATETKDVTIFYTTDGSEPGKLGGRSRSGTEYTGPVPIGRSTVLRAIAVKTGWKSSNVPTQTYAFFDRDVGSFSSNLPVVVIDTFGRNVNQNVHTLGFAGFIETDDRGRKRLTTRPDFTSRIGIDIRGKSSTSFAKKQYHFETWNENNKEKAVSLLGFPAESDWVLQGPYSDKSLMRNYLSYNWSNDLGRYASRTKFIEVFLNSNDGRISLSDYVGVYVLMEKIKRNKNRVDIAALEPADDAEPEITGGYIFKKDKLDSGEPTFSTSTGLTLIYVDPNGFDITEAQKTWLKDYINEFEAALNGPKSRDPDIGYAKYIDLDSFIDIHILVELTKNIDGFRLSTYMFKDRGGKINMGPAWDYNLSLGNDNYLEGWLPAGWYYDLISAGDYPWWRRLFDDPAFQRRYADRWFALRGNLLATDRLLGEINDAAALLNEAQARNFVRWKILGTYIWPNWYIANTYQEEITWMKGWLEDRLTWMDMQIGREHAAAPPAFSVQSGQFEHGVDLEMSAERGTIYYTLDGTDPYRPVTWQVPTSTLVAEDAEKRVLIPIRAPGDAWKETVAFSDRSWPKSTGSPGGIGYDRAAFYNGYLSLDIEAQMYDRSSSCYIRIPFTFSGNINELESLKLNIRYDDGFVAYINGTEVARRNVAEPLTWNSGAAGDRPNSEAVQVESIDITGSLATLQQGSNLLAIHGLNSSAADPDFLISVELVAPAGESDTPVLPGLELYSGPITLTETTRIKARAVTGNTWSAMKEATFAIGPGDDT